LATATDNSVIVFKSATNSFVVEPANNIISTLDNGFF
jgi:hypothetical protein